MKMRILHIIQDSEEQKCGAVVLCAFFRPTCAFGRTPATSRIRQVVFFFWTAAWCAFLSPRFFSGAYASLVTRTYCLCISYPCKPIAWIVIEIVVIYWSRTVVKSSMIMMIYGDILNHFLHAVHSTRLFLKLWISVMFQKFSYNQVFRISSDVLVHSNQFCLVQLEIHHLRGSL